MSDTDFLPVTTNERATGDGLRLRRNGSVLTGVCSGIAHFLALDVTLVRGVALGLAAVSGLGVLAYVTAAFLMPPADAGPQSGGRPWFDGYTVVQQCKESTRAMLRATMINDKRAFQAHWNRQVQSLRQAFRNAVTAAAREQRVQI